jgi:hypothetical protein
VMWSISRLWQSTWRPTVFCGPRIAIVLLSASTWGLLGELGAGAQGNHPVCRSRLDASSPGSAADVELVLCPAN